MTRSSVSSRRAGRTAAHLTAFVLGLLLLAPGIPWAAARDPRSGDAFEYDYHMFLDQGTGDYDGYSETMTSHASYRVLSVIGNNSTVLGQGAWTWQASDGSSQSGVLDVQFSFSLATRRYLAGIDVDGNYSDPAVWFWIPTPAVPGRVVRILDDDLTVTSVDATVWLGLLPRKALRVESWGSYFRDDVYGQFTADYHDQYYFEADTGFILAEFYEENDHSGLASFRWREQVLVTASSYPMPLDWVSFGAVFVGIPAVIVATLYGIRRYYRGPRTVLGRTAEGVRAVTVRRLTRPGFLAGLEPGGSRFFAPFLSTFARRALASADPVVIATAGHRIEGLLTYDGESGVGSLFAASPAVASGLLKLLKVQDYFAEVDDPAWKPAGRVLDTFEVLALDRPAAVPYDSAIVRPMTAADQPAVTAIAEAVYLGRAARWVSTCFQDGDLGFVGEIGGRVVAFGFATVAGTAARLHTLTVLPQHRAMGIGSELMAARLSTLSALGVERVVVEISKNNTASLRVALKAGFVRVGETQYVSSSPEDANPVVQRQF